MTIIINDDSKEVISREGKTYRTLVRLKVNSSLIRSSILSIKKIQFTNCQFSEGVHFEEDLKSLDYIKIELVFIDCYIEEKCLFKHLENPNLNFTFINCVVIGLEVEGCEIDTIYFGRTLFWETARINENNLKHLTIQNCLGNLFVIDTGKTTCSLQFRDDNLSVIKDKVFKLLKKIVQTKKLKNILHLQSRFYFYDLKEIDVRSIFSEKKAGFVREIKPGSKDNYKDAIKYYVSHEERRKMNLSVTLSQRYGVTKKLSVSNCLLSGLTLQGVSESTVNINHCEIDNVYIDGFKSLESNFYDVKNRNNVDSHFQILNSKFPESTFFNVKFNSFSRVNFYKSYFDKSQFSATTFPKEIMTVENIHEPDKKENEYANVQYELYRQLKSSLISNQNQISALDMHKRMYNAAILQNDHTPEDKLIMCLNQLSNNHGTSIRKAFLLSVGLVVLFWIFYCLFLPNAPFKLGFYGLESLKRGVFDFWMFSITQLKALSIFANPLHNINNLKELNKFADMELGTEIYFVSFFSRLFVAWGYYQFIAAFRKFGKVL